MSVRVTWLKEGHVVHGYRRVFLLHDTSTRPLGAIVFAPMGYQEAYRIKELCQQQSDYEPVDIDATLVWGLSLVELAFGQGSPLEEDGYVKARPTPLQTSDLIPAERYQLGVRQGYLDINP